MNAKNNRFFSGAVCSDVFLSEVVNGMGLKVKTVLFAYLIFVASCCLAKGTGLAVSNIRSSQANGSFFVDITYDLVDTNRAKVPVTLALSDNGGATYVVTATSFTGDIGGNVTPGMNKKITWDAGKDWPNNYSTNFDSGLRLRMFYPHPLA